MIACTAEDLGLWIVWGNILATCWLRYIHNGLDSSFFFCIKTKGLHNQETHALAHVKWRSRTPELEWIDGIKSGLPRVSRLVCR